MDGEVITLMILLPTATSIWTQPKNLTMPLCDTCEGLCLVLHSPYYNWLLTCWVTIQLLEAMTNSCDSCLPGTKCFEKLPVSERVQAWQNLATSQAADWVNVAHNNLEIGDFTWSKSLPFVLSNGMRFHLKWIGRQRLFVIVQFPCTKKQTVAFDVFKMVKVQ